MLPCLLLTVCSCSLPDVTVERKARLVDAPAQGALTNPGFSAFHDTDANGKPYLATVHIRFTEDARPLTFDIRRNRQETITFNMIRSEETSTYVHFGYTRSDGANAGLRFIWRFTE